MKISDLDQLCALRESRLDLQKRTAAFARGNIEITATFGPTYDLAIERADANTCMIRAAIMDHLQARADALDKKIEALGVELDDVEEGSS